MEPATLQKCAACESTNNIPVKLGFGGEGRQCRNCSLVWSVKTSDTKQLYDSAYNKDSEGFIWQAFLDTHEKIKSTQQVSLNWYENYFLKNVKPAGSANILEIGCSVGRFLFGCKNNGWKIHGLDISSRAIELSKDLLPDGDFQTGTVEKSKWPKETFEAITCWEVIEHVEDPFVFTGKIKELLLYNGIFAFSTPDWDSPVIRRHPKKNYWPPYHNWFFSEKSINTLLNRAGLKIIKIKRNPIPWSETCWPHWLRFVSLPYLVYKGIIAGQGGGRIVVLAKKI
jgi:2-polyprenyl-3-methyl-5-hydroxy-6-metoxy-1,4-benzoquinol methylase